MSTQQPMSDEEFVQSVYNYAAQQLQNGVSPSQVESQLLQQGLDPDSARRVVFDLTHARTKAINSEARSNMLYGALWCVGGTVVTVLSFGAASSSPGGGSYVVAYGAIIFGAIQFFRGLSQMSSR